MFSKNIAIRISATYTIILTGILLLLSSYINWTQADTPDLNRKIQGVHEQIPESAIIENDRDASGNAMPVLSENESNLPAFPGAEGFGAHAAGGRGGKLYRVTNLNDSGPGSFREAAEAEGRRMVIFDVSGTIKLESPVWVENPYVTFAGQTAPNGITITNEQVRIQTHDVILRHMRFRHGVDIDQEPHRVNVDEWTLRVHGSRDVILDHITVSWGMDGNLGVTNSRYVTVQNSVLDKPLTNSVHYKGNRGYGALVRGHSGSKYSFLRNLWANHRRRVPMVGNYFDPGDDPIGILMDFRNNVILDGIGYNYDIDGQISRYNFVNNYFITNWKFQERNTGSQAHFSGNYIGGEHLENQWLLVDFQQRNIDRDFYEQTDPFETAEATTLPAPEAWEYVMNQAGIWRRDTHDKNVFREVHNEHRRIVERVSPEYELPDWWRTGRIDNQVEVGGLPEIESVIVPEWIDSNRNGIPDWWEAKHGLDSSDPDIANMDSNGNGYTNLEDYLNDLEAIEKTHGMTHWADACFVVAPYVTNVDENSAHLAWVSPVGIGAGEVQLQDLDSGREQTVTAEQIPSEFLDGQKEVKDVVHNVATLDGLNPFTEYEYRVKCGNGSSTLQGTFMTMPEPDQVTEFEFSVLADSYADRGSTYKHSDNVHFMSEAVGAEQNAFVVHAGGLISGKDSDWERWISFFTMARPYLKSSSFWPVMSFNTQQTPRNFHALFHPVSDEKPEKALTSFIYGNLQFFILDLNRDMESLLDEVGQELANSQAEWKIVTYHYPGPNVGGSGNLFASREEKELAAVFEEYGVDLVIYGGDQIYERKRPIGAEGRNPVHYVSLNSGADFHAVRPSPIVKGGIGRQEHVYARFRVDDNLLEMEAVTSGGSVVDRLELEKGTGGMVQPEILEQAIDLDLAVELAHVYTGQCLSEDLRYERRDLMGEVDLLEPPVTWGNTEVILKLPVEVTGNLENGDGKANRFPVGSELIVLKRNEPGGWHTEVQELEITGDPVEIIMTAPSDFMPGGPNPKVELSVNLLIEERVFEPVVLRPYFEPMGQVELVYPLYQRTSTRPEFVWEATPGALAYCFQISKTNFRTLTEDTIVTDVSFEIPEKLKEDENYRWRVRALGLDQGPWTTRVTFYPVMTEVPEGLPTRFRLDHNYPNPFNPSTTIRYALPVDAHVAIRVYDVIGREVAILVNEEQRAGYHQTVFDSGGLASGVYHYRLEAKPGEGSVAGRFVQTRSMTLIK